MRTAEPLAGREAARARERGDDAMSSGGRELTLARELALVIARAETLEDALEVALRLICETTGWGVGEAWLRTGGSQLQCSRAWYAAHEDLLAFRRETEGFVIGPGTGLIGAAWESKQPVWMRDVSSDPRFLRKELARKAGLRAGIAVPVLNDHEVVAVLAFFVAEPRGEDERFVELVSATGTHLGALIRRRQIEEALRRSEEQLRAVADTAVDAIVSSDSDGDITYFNSSAERIFGYGWGELMGRSLTVLMPERFRAAHEQGLRRFIETGESRLIGKTLELAGLRKDGSEFPLEIALSHWRTDDKDFFTAMLRDISERKHAEEALRQSDGMKTALLRSVSHDFRSPLTAIVAAGETLATLDLEPAPRQELASVIVGQAARLATLVDKLLDLSRLQGGVASPRQVSCSIQDIIDNALDLLPEAGTGFELDIEERLPDVRVDPTQLERALGNLFENARRYSDGRPVKVRASSEAGGVTVRVSDRGPGIAEREREQIFEPFYQGGGDAADRRGGSGLGLAIVKGFVAANGGRVSVESELGQGSTFVVELPRDTGESKEREPN